MANLSDAIDECIRLKVGNKEFALMYLADEAPLWRADIGNPNTSVLLGEINGEFRGEGETAEAAVAELLANLKAGRLRS